MFQAVGFKLVFMFSLISSGTFSPTAHIYADLNCPVGVCVCRGGGLTGELLGYYCLMVTDCIRLRRPP